MRRKADIIEEIERLKAGWQSWQDLEKLDLLERTLARYNEPEPESTGYSRAAMPDTDDFAAVASAVPKETLIAALAEHMDAVKAIYPKEYDAIMRKLRA